MSHEISGTLVVIKGGGDVGSAVAHLLFGHDYIPVIVESETPSTTRRRMAFAAAVFDGEAELEGVRAERVESLAALRALLIWKKVVPVFVGSLEDVLREFSPPIVIDARMRKRDIPETQIAQAPFTIGLGPGLVAGQTVHVVIETSRGPTLGQVITEGRTEPYTGEPISIAGYKRERYAYAPVAGTFHTQLEIGTTVHAGDLLGQVENHELRAQVDGIIRGITKDGIEVKQGTKVAAVDPRGQAEFTTGIAERPRKIAEGVLEAIRRR
ncbi:MAG: EF2563 family selenium-dependent molybdenum hydroxylase system protein [Deltaproteobacteria bacterium]|nr:EF2563 family selenium-dependent molybdenum hydroxylase system protein [Deltaproteobacteria bacterium]